MSNPAEEEKLVKKAADELGEMFDSVQIFVSRHESGEHNGTIRINKGTGNWFTRYGQVREWLIREDETSRIGARKDNEEPS